MLQPRIHLRVRCGSQIKPFWSTDDELYQLARRPNRAGNKMRCHRAGPAALQPIKRGITNSGDEYKVYKAYPAISPVSNTQSLGEGLLSCQTCL